MTPPFFKQLLKTGKNIPNRSKAFPNLATACSLISSEPWLKVLLATTLALNSANAAADSECGVAVGGDTVICNGDGSPVTDTDPYANGIRYNIGGITLNVNGAANSINSGIRRGIEVIATDTNNITVDTSDATPVEITTSGLIAHGIMANHSGTAGAVTINSAGSINTSGGTSYALNIRSENTNNADDVTVNLNSGSITTTGSDGRGLHALHHGLGAITVNSSIDVNTAGNNAFALYSQATNAANTEAITLNITGGTITTSGNNAFGIYGLRGGLGELNINSAGNIATSGNFAAGIFANGTQAANTEAFNINMSSGSINTTGQFGYGIYALQAGSGDINIQSAGSITTNGSDAQGIVGAISRGGSSAGINIDLMLGGTVTTSGDNSHGMHAEHRGAGGFTINSDGEIITTGANAHGITVVQTNNIAASGNAVITLNNNVSAGGNGINVNTLSSGETQITTSANVTAANSGILVNNTAAGNIAVTINQAVAAGTGFAIDTATGTGTSIVTLNSGASVGSTAGLAISNNAGDSTTVVNTGANVSGEIRLGDGSDNLSFVGGDFSNVTVFDGGDDTASADTFIDTLTFANTSGTVAGANILNWEQITLESSANITVSDNTLTAGTLSINNGGSFNTSNNFSLNSNLMLAAGSRFGTTGAGSSTLIVNGDVSNSGTIDMQDGITGDSLTINGNYIGGGAINIDTALGGSNSQTDTVVINGNSSGSTALNVNNVGGSGGITGDGVTDGIKIVEVTGVSTGEFTLSGPITVGAFSYDITANGYLQSTLQQQVFSYGALKPVLRDSINSLWQRNAHRQAYQQTQSQQGERTDQKSGIWVRSSYADTDAALDTTVSNATQRNDLHTIKSMLQVGYEQALHTTHSGFLSAGIFAHYKQVKLNVNNIAPSPIQLASAEADGYGGGVSLTWTNPTGLYADLVGQVTAYDIETQSDTANDKFDSITYTVSAESGYRIALENTLNFVPQLQLVWREVNIDNFADSTGAKVGWNNKGALTGRLGFALEGTDTHYAENGSGFSSYAITNLMHDFDDMGEISVSGTDTESVLSKTRAELRLGVNYRSKSGKYGFYSELGRTQSLTGKDYSRFKALAGLNLNW